jgi:hypothetical protein
MRIDLAAFNSDGSPATQGGGERDVAVVVYDYPKSEPVLESSYLFPEVDSYGHWYCSTLGVDAVPKNR